jgi:hypothetical protein
LHGIAAKKGAEHAGASLVAAAVLAICLLALLEVTNSAEAASS